MPSEDFRVLGVEFDCPQCQKAGRPLSRIPVPRVMEKLDACFSKNDLQSAARLLTYWQGEAVAVSDISGELSIVNEMLGLYRKLEAHKEAEEAVTRALALLDQTRTDKEISGATVLLNAATTRKAFGQVEQALPLYEKARRIYEQKLPSDDVRHAALWNNYATALSDLGHFEEAERLYKQAIALTSRAADSLPDCAVSYVNLASLYEQWEGITSSRIEEQMQKAEEILETAPVKRDGYYAFVCEKCAPAFDYYGYFALAKDLRERAKEIYERT